MSSFTAMRFDYGDCHTILGDVTFEGQNYAVRCQLNKVDEKSKISTIIDSVFEIIKATPVFRFADRPSAVMMGENGIVKQIFEHSISETSSANADLQQALKTMGVLKVVLMPKLEVAPVCDPLNPPKNISLSKKKFNKAKRCLSHIYQKSFYGYIDYLKSSKFEVHGLMALAAEMQVSSSTILLTNKAFHNVLEKCEGRIQAGPQAPANFLTAFNENINTLLNRRHLTWDEYTEELQNKLLTLASNECLVLTLSQEGHGMSGVVLKEVDGTFTYYHFNSGSQSFNHVECVRKGTIRCSVLIKKGIATNEMLDFIALSQKQGVPIADVYSFIRSMGTFSVTNESRFWQMAQFGGCCAGRCRIDMLKAFLHPDSFNLLILELKLQAVSTIYKCIEQGKYSSYSSRTAILEIINELEETALAQEVKDYLCKIKQYIQPMTSKCDILQKKAPNLAVDILREINLEKSIPFTDLARSLNHASKLYAVGEYESANALLASWISNEQEKLSLKEGRNIFSFLQKLESLKRDNTYSGLVIKAAIIVIALDAGVVFDQLDEEMQDFLLNCLIQYTTIENKMLSNAIWYEKAIAYVHKTWQGEKILFPDTNEKELNGRLHAFASMIHPSIFFDLTKNNLQFFLEHAIAIQDYCAREQNPLAFLNILAANNDERYRLLHLSG